MIKIHKITIRETVEVVDEKARINIKKLLADVLKVDIANIEMRYESKI